VKNVALLQVDGPLPGHRERVGWQRQPAEGRPYVPGHPCMVLQQFRFFPPSASLLHLTPLPTLGKKYWTPTADRRFSPFDPKDDNWAGDTRQSYNSKPSFAEHYADDLEVDLEEIMLADFHTETEDESHRLVSKELVALHNELLMGNSATVNRLQQALPVAITTSVRQTVGIWTPHARNYSIVSTLEIHGDAPWLPQD
jgi:hypothetical protein